MSFIRGQLKINEQSWSIKLKGIGIQVKILSIYLCIYLSACHLSMYLSLYLSVCPSVRPSVRPSNHPSIYASTALCWTPAAFSVSWSYTQTVGLLGRVISPLQGRYLHTEQHKHRINAHRHRCFEWDLNPRSQRSSEYFKPRGHCNRQEKYFQLNKPSFSIKTPNTRKE
jgi:hypothetical protein